MLQDYNAVKEETKEYEGYIADNNNQAQQSANANSNFDFTIKCLKTANWPSFKVINLQMPPYIDDKFQ